MSGEKFIVDSDVHMCTQFQYLEHIILFRGVLAIAVDESISRCTRDGSVFNSFSRFYKVN